MIHDPGNTDGNDPEVESVQQLDLTALVPASGESLVYLSLRYGSTEAEPYFVDEIGATQNKFVQDSFVLEATNAPIAAPKMIRTSSGWISTAMSPWGRKPPRTEPKTTTRPMMKNIALTSRLPSARCARSSSPQLVAK